LVVIARDVAFRMHQSTLALRSEIFRDIFSLPSPADLNSAPLETIEGFLVVRVTDSLAEIRHLFLVLCCGKNYLVDRDEDTAVPFPVISALIRMTHKYAVEEFLEEALSRLQKYYTNDFSAWRDRAARGTRYVHVEDNDALGVYLARTPNKHPVPPPTAFLAYTQITDS
ncbi:hypothetical protein DICSQDRAFT_68002, partial [Dichomitus squalens LYAD-421 SS1]